MSLDLSNCYLVLQIKLGIIFIFCGISGIWFQGIQSSSVQSTMKTVNLNVPSLTSTSPY